MLPRLIAIAWLCSSCTSGKSEPAPDNANNNANNNAHANATDITEQVEGAGSTEMAAGSESGAQSIAHSAGRASPSFVPPDVRTRIRAAGNRAGLSEILRTAFAPSSPTFTALGAPSPGDWLDDHRELGQTYDAYVASRPNRPDKFRNVIYLLPIGSLGADAPPVDWFADFARVQFGLAVEVLKPIELSKTGARMRTRDNGLVQVNAEDILQFLKTDIPTNAYCIIALTGTDLFPSDGWNFVFGMASTRERVGVYSVARYHPSFYGDQDFYPKPEIWVHRRAAKVMAHEIAHMFGLEHCTYYECVMNGSNHLAETDRRPIHLCPVCLHKLHYATGFDPAERYRKLSEFFYRSGLGPEATWTERRAEVLEPLKSPTRP